MNAAADSAPARSAPLRSAYGRLPDSLPQRLGRLLRWPLTAAALLGALYLVFLVYMAGQTSWALGTLTLLAAGFYAYLSRASFALRYLFPGIAGMLVFVAFPLIYTAQIGFTNYSSAHLLSEERARDYLLDQHEVVEAQVLNFTLHTDATDATQYRLLLSDPELATPLWLSPALTLTSSAPIRLTVQAAADTKLPAADTALPLRELIRHRDALRGLTLQVPGQPELRYLGLREFGPVQQHWQAASDGSLTRHSDGQVFKPDRERGNFSSASGELLQPGFKVMVGWRNYARMVLDADFRGPFLAIFSWTVLFSALTVLFATAIGMLLAVLLNWEDLKYRATYRTLLFLPYAVPGFISILVFKGLFNQNFGEINAILDALLGVKPAWFADPLLAKVMLLIVNVWLGYPYIMILCAGLLKAIPADLYEASAIAGAGPLTNFFKITAPLIIKPLAPLLVSAFAFNFNNFVLIALLTDGRPDFLSTKIPAGQTDILVSYTYRIAFKDSGSDFGLAAAISTLIFFLVAALSLLNLRLMRKTQD